MADDLGLSPLSEQQLVLEVEAASKQLADAVKAAEAGGVSEALIFPALVGVFREAGMVPDWLDIGSLAGLLGG